MKQLFLILFILFSYLALTAQEAGEVLFYDSDKSVLTVNQANQLDKLIERFKANQIKKVNIRGYTDTTSNEKHNVELSKYRAVNVKNYFLTKGIIEALINVAYYGESKAESQGDLLRDRRVEVNISYNETNLIAIDQKQTTISDLYKSTLLKPQEFCINPNRDTLIVCEKGTIITIKAKTFKLDQSQQQNASCVLFQVKEAYLKSEMILENLTTTAGDNILETMGMLYSNAMSGDDTLELQKDIVVMLPTDTVVEGAKMFDGVRNPHSDIINWSVSNNSVLRNFSVSDIEKCNQPNYGFCRWCPECITDSLMNDTTLRSCYRGCLLGLCLGMCEKCQFFFCRIKRILKPIQGTFNRQIRSDNKGFRECQRKLRIIDKITKSAANGARLSINDLSGIRRDFIRDDALNGRTEMTENEKKLLELTTLMEKSDNLIIDGLVDTEIIAKCNELDSLFSEYSVDKTEDLIKAINRPLMEEFNVSTMKELLDTLPKVNLEKVEVAYRNKQISFEDYKFYVFNSSKLGWKNIDVFADIPKNKMTKIEISVKPTKTADCKLVFKDRNFVLPAKIDTEYFYFDGIPIGEKAWLVGINYENGIPFLAMKEITIKKQSFDLEFKERTLEQLKEDLKVLDF